MGKPDVKLLMVTADNHNKFYNMHDNDNGTMTVTYGRVGSSSVEKDYPISDWDKKYSEKTKKGYKDVTKNTSQLKGFVACSDKELQQMLDYFYNVSRYTIAKETESVDISDSATLEAQTQLDIMAKTMDVVNPDQNTLNAFNKALLQLFIIIPRKMKNVKDALCKSLDDRNFYIQKEQTLLDNLVTMSKSRPNQSGTETLDSAFGFRFGKCTDEEIEFIKKKITDCGISGAKFSRAWTVYNGQREAGFAEYLANNKLAKNDNNIKLYWHGTDPTRILSIMATGLGIGYACNGCYGRGIYNAPKINKALGYASYDNNPDGKRVTYMFINAVITGNVFMVHGTSTHYGAYSVGNMDGEKFSSADLGYHSIESDWGRGKGDPGSEAIVYNQNQVACKYLVELNY